MATEKERILCTMWYLMVILTIGLPVWWLSTRVHRVAIPFNEIDGTVNVHDIDEININDEGQEVICFNLNVYIVVDRESAVNDLEFLRSLQQFFDRNHVDVIAAGRVKVHVDSVREFGKALSLDYGQFGDLFLVRNLSKSVQSRFMMGPGRIVYSTPDFKDFELHEFLTNLLISSRTPHDFQNFNIQISLINSRLFSKNLRFDPRRLKYDHLNPYLDVLRQHKLISSEMFIQNLNLKLKPNWDFSLNQYVYSNQHLEDSVHLLDHHLFTSTYVKPVLNLVVYFIPSEGDLALFKYDDGRINDNMILNAFIPSWGGIIMVKLPLEVYRANVSGTFYVNEKIIASNIIDQINKFILVPEREKFDDLADSQIQNWQLDIMMVNRLLRQYKSTIDNLKSLSEMLEIIGEITVEQEIADDIRTVIAKLNKAKSFLKTNRFSEALQLTNETCHLTKLIFSNPRLIADSYFPDNQRYAIYLPIFVPLIVPIISSPMALLKYFKKAVQ